MGTNISDYQEQLRIRTEYANEVIQKYLPVEEGYLTELVSAMNYSVMVGGKRLRPVLLIVYIDLWVVKVKSASLSWQRWSIFTHILLYTMICRK